MFDAKAEFNEYILKAREGKGEKSGWVKLILTNPEDCRLKNSDGSFNKGSIEAVRLFKHFKRDDWELETLDYVPIIGWDEAFVRAFESLSALELTEEKCQLAFIALQHLEVEDILYPTTDNRGITELLSVARIILAKRELLETGKAPEVAQRVWELLKGYPTDTRSCLLDYEQRAYVYRVCGHVKAAEEIEKEMDRRWAGIKKAVLG